MTKLLTVLTLSSALLGNAFAKPSQVAAIRSAVNAQLVKQHPEFVASSWTIKKLTGPRGGKTFTAFAPLGTRGAQPGLLETAFVKGSYTVKGNKISVRVGKIGIAY